MHNDFGSSATLARAPSGFWHRSCGRGLLVDAGTEGFVVVAIEKVDGMQEPGAAQPSTSMALPSKECPVLCRIWASWADQNCGCVIVVVAVVATHSRRWEGVVEVCLWCLWIVATNATVCAVPPLVQLQVSCLNRMHRISPTGNFPVVPQTHKPGG